MHKDLIDQAIVKLRIVVVALVLGVATFGAIAYLLVQGQGLTTDSSLQIPLLGALGALTIGLLFVFPMLERTLIQGSGEGELDQNRAVTAYSTMVIVRSAMIESVGLFGGVIYLVTAHPAGLLALVASIGLLYAHRPSRSGAEAWISRMEEAARSR